ncbi:fatty-acid peroxygenase [Paractinoplanes ferrugineus]|uniref:Fatty-acid peroxygenase n=1 Tax=Paractinoplanes ferrugineus TaxID=113564 RepID=A0A919IX39_9ACTN|nr:cytochrome P450 [Actinoplanes ferrugineus]GIE09552.1 fatty-acid peroxygenase [Actinoplanes ferrugineus]
MATALRDQTAAIPIKGYAWLPDLRRRTHGQPAPIRLMGRPAVAIGGPAAAQFFYAAGHIQRHDAIPGMVLDTLFGRGAVHTLDGHAHELRKAMFVSLLIGDGVDTLAKHVGTAFDEAVDARRGGPPFSLFDETAEVIAEAVRRWVGIPDGVLPAADLVAMVDGFATAGPRQARARLARRRQERRLARLIEDVRREEPSPNALSAIAHHTADGYLMDARTAAVELLNIVRPATAVSYFVAFAAHALERWPGHRQRVADDDRYALACTDEVRRFYPFVPFLGGLAAQDLHFQRTPIRQGTMVLLDVYGQHHDERVWPEPYRFRPERFLDRPVGPFELIPQGGGDPRTGHRCPGEQITIALLSTITQRLARLDYYLPPQNLSIDLSRIPARVSSGPRIAVV